MPKKTHPNVVDSRRGKHRTKPFHPTPTRPPVNRQDMRLFRKISAKVQNPNVSAKDLARLSLIVLTGGISYILSAKSNAGITSNDISQYHLTGRTDTTWGDKMTDVNASIPRTSGGKTRRRSRK
jgi:hypothetical protein